MLIKHRPALYWLVFAAVAFWMGRYTCHHSFDFLVYYEGARSFLAGRTDLYSDTFAVGPPMVYVYPPLFMLLIFPLGWLSLANAHGVWFMAMALATAAVIRRAYRQWRPQHRARCAWLLLALAGPLVAGELKSGNAHLLIVLLLISAVTAWSQGRVWAASLAVAMGGAIKIFPLFLLPVFIVRREWPLVTRVIGLSCLLWLLPVIYFGPRRTVALYRSWANPLVFHLSRFENQHSLDQSIQGTATRWLTHVDYATHLDGDYPQVNVATLSRRALKAVTYGIEGIILALSLWMCALLRPVAVTPGTDRHRQLCVATAGAIFTTFQLLLGPYTPVLYLCGWLLVALILPALTEHKKYVHNLLLAAGTLNLLFFLVPGRIHQRALQAHGVFTVLGFVLWALSMWCGWILARKKLNTSASHPSVADHAEVCAQTALVVASKNRDSLLPIAEVRAARENLPIRG